MLSRVLPLDNLQRVLGRASLEMYDDWLEAPDWILAFWPDLDNETEAKELYAHLHIWRRRAMAGTVVWIWVNRSYAAEVQLLVEAAHFFVQVAPTSVNSPKALLQCTIPWGIRAKNSDSTVNAIRWAQMEISRFCKAQPTNPLSRELTELTTSRYRNDYLTYLPERLDLIVKAIQAEVDHPDDYFAFQEGDWHIERWRPAWSRLRDASRSLTFWANNPIAPADLAPDGPIDTDKAAFYYHYWWEQLNEPPQVIWSPWMFHMPSAAAALERGAIYACATWKPLPNVTK